ncbi:MULTISPECIES: hypothetical protein [unclassified Streptomyces]|uniref:hypothetical protein n=1 Tax=unclassified Streptomyces TaxID=2593676 RepID=UPI0037AC60D8
MTRTRQQRIRKACLADAANGIHPIAPSRVSRVRVVLYGTALDGLRRYAQARDWTIVAEFPSDGDGTAESAWPCVTALLEARRAEGVVTDAESVAVDDVERLHAFSVGVRST